MGKQVVNNIIFDLFNKPAVYKITSPSGRVYIGSTVNVKNRYRKYKSANCHCQVRLYNSIMKYGFHNHKFEILFYCLKSQLRQLEAYFGEKYNVLDSNIGLNCRLPKYGDIVSVSESTRLKMKNAKIGKKDSMETRMKKSSSLIESYSNSDRRNKISKALTGKPKSENHKYKLSLLHRKKIIDMKTGVIYECVNAASHANNIKRTTLSAMLSGQNPNRTSLRYLYLSENEASN